MDDGEKIIQDVGRQLHDMLKDIDSISVHSSKALETLEAKSLSRSQAAACFETSIECIKVSLMFFHAILCSTYTDSVWGRPHLPAFLAVPYMCIHELETAALSRTSSRGTPLRSRCSLRLWLTNFSASLLMSLPVLSRFDCCIVQGALWSSSGGILKQSVSFWHRGQSKCRILAHFPQN